MMREEIKNILNGLMPLCGTANIEPRIEDLVSICESKIKQACDKQIEICAETYRDSGYWNHPSYDAILNSSYPEGIK